jgi:hypothetical protein
VPDTSQLISLGSTYGIDFNNFKGKWYSVTQLTNLLENAKAVYNAFVLMRDSAVPVSKQEGRFTTNQIADGQFITSDALTSKQRAGIIAMRQYDTLLLERGVQLSDLSITAKLKLPKMRPDIVNEVAGTNIPNYSQTDATKYGINFVSMMLNSSQIKGIFDIYATIDLADYICKVYDTSIKIINLHNAFGQPVSIWSSLTDLNKQCGALASFLVNKPLFQYSDFTFNHAYFFDMEKISIQAADQPKTEYNLAVAQREVANLTPFTPVEEIFTGKAFIESHAEKFSKNDLYSIVLPKMFTWASKNYYYVKARFNQNDPAYALSLPSDPVTTSPVWQPGESLKYGVYGSVGIYPGLDVSADSVSNSYRNSVFANVRSMMQADSTLKSLDAVMRAIDTQLALTPKFRPTEWPLLYS